MSDVGDLDQAIQMYEQALDFGENVSKNSSFEERRQMNAYKGIVYNNLGMAYSQKFVLKSQEPMGPGGLTQERIQAISGFINEAVQNLKKSVVNLENFEQRLATLSATDGEQAAATSEVKMIDIDTKLFLDEFFDHTSYEVAKKDFK